VDGLGDSRGSSNKAGEESRGNNSETHFDGFGLVWFGFERGLDEDSRWWLEKRW
jgi:hypothetical protein